MHVANEVAQIDAFRLLTDGSELPVFAFTIADGIDGFTVFDVSRVLREKGWLVPAYSFPENRQDLSALRIVVRNGFDRDMADLLINDIRGAAEYLSRLEAPMPPDPSPHNFHH
jgi:glutamate decarboxylase